MNIALIGYRGTGKTTVARLLAEQLQWRWLDADVELEQRAGCSIAEVFAQGGETAFRDLESEVLQDLAQLDKHVLSLGGGVVLRPENEATIRTLGKVIWLTAPPTIILDRITRDATTAGRRPNLTTAGGLAEVEQLLAMRTPIYRRCADLEVDTESKRPAEITAEIIDRMHLHPDQLARNTDQA